MMTIRDRIRVNPGTSLLDPKQAGFVLSPLSLLSSANEPEHAQGGHFPSVQPASDY